MADPNSSPKTTTEQSLKRIYRLIVDGDHVTVIGDNGRPIPIHEFDEMGILLRRARAQARDTEQIMQANALRWKFPSKRSHIYAVGSCVYVITPTATNYTDKLPSELRRVWPNVAKIGYTQTSLTGRCSTLARQFGGGLTVYAFAYSNHPAEAESGMHAILTDAHVHGEWFDRDYVMGYLAGGAL
jgi:hypothetical protein